MAINSYKNNNNNNVVREAVTGGDTGYKNEAEMVIFIKFVALIIIRFIMVHKSDLIQKNSDYATI